jgi:hypothetical protein
MVHVVLESKAFRTHLSIVSKKCKIAKEVSLNRSQVIWRFNNRHKYFINHYVNNRIRF